MTGTESAPVVRVVVADDQELVRGGFAMILDAQPDIEVVAEAGDGLQAVAAVREHAPDVLLLDIRMPRMDGIEAARIVCAESACRVLMLTTFDLDDYVYDALRAGASGFLLKDVRRDDLVNAVRVVAAGESLLAPTVTTRLIARVHVQAREARRPGRRGAGRTDRPGARDAAADRPRAVQRGDRRGPGGQRAHREDARQQPAHQARPARPGAGGDRRLRVRAGRAGGVRRGPEGRPGPMTERIDGRAVVTMAAEDPRA